MKRLSNGTRVPLSNGTTAIVKAFLGEGGQGARNMLSRFIPAARRLHFCAIWQTMSVKVHLQSIFYGL